MRIGIILALLGGMILFISSNLGDPDAELARYDELQAAGTPEYTAKISDHFKKTSKHRRGQRTVYCPVYTYTTSSEDDAPVRTHRDRGMCVKNLENLKVGREVPIMIDPETSRVYRTDPAGREALVSDVKTGRLIPIFGWAALGIGVVTVLGSVFARLNPKPATDDDDYVYVPPKKPKK